MFSQIVQSSEPILLVGGGSLHNLDIEMASTYAKAVVAADGGASAVVQSGRLPDAVIGDFDSLDEATRAAIPKDRLHHVSEQDSTDFEKCLQRVDAPLVVCVGFTGGRMDHGLAVLHGLLKFAHQPVVLLGKEDVIFLCPPSLGFPSHAGMRVSLFPLTLVCGTSTGLEWPIDGIELAPGKRVGTSNAATGDKVTVCVDAPGLLCLLPRTQLGSVIQVLQSVARWPAL